MKGKITSTVSEDIIRYESESGNTRVVCSLRTATLKPHIDGIIDTNSEFAEKFIHEETLLDDAEIYANCLLEAVKLGRLRAKQKE